MQCFSLVFSLTLCGGLIFPSCSSCGQTANSQLPWRELAVICVYTYHCYRAIAVCQLSLINGCFFHLNRYQSSTVTFYVYMWNGSDDLQYHTMESIQTEVSVVNGTEQMLQIAEVFMRDT